MVHLNPPSPPVCRTLTTVELDSVRVLLVDVRDPVATAQPPPLFRIKVHSLNPKCKTYRSLTDYSSFFSGGICRTVKMAVHAFECAAKQDRGIVFEEASAVFPGPHLRVACDLFEEHEEVMTIPLTLEPVDVQEQLMNALTKVEALQEELNRMREKLIPPIWSKLIIPKDNGKSLTVQVKISSGWEHDPLQTQNVMRFFSRELKEKYESSMTSELMYLLENKKFSEFCRRMLGMKEKRFGSAAHWDIWEKFFQTRHVVSVCGSFGCYDQSFFLEVVFRTRMFFDPPELGRFYVPSCSTDPRTLGRLVGMCEDSNSPIGIQ